MPEQLQHTILYPDHCTHGGGLKRPAQRLDTVFQLGSDAELPVGHHDPTTAMRETLQGLGEMMPEQLWQTTLNPATRSLRRLTLEDAAAASSMFTLLMGGAVEPRKKLIEDHGSNLSLAELDI